MRYEYEYKPLNEDLAADLLKQYNKGNISVPFQYFLKDLEKNTPDKEEYERKMVDILIEIMDAFTLRTGAAKLKNLSTLILKQTNVIEQYKKEL